MNMDVTKKAKDEDVFTARPYQEQLLDIVMAKNTIVFLPTGAGKTFIALMAIKRMAQSLELPLSQGGKRTVFLVNTVVLAHQQAQMIRAQMPFRTAVYTGDMNVDAWRREDWQKMFDQNQIHVATAQIILDVVQHGYMSMSQFNLIIFDECHHARGNHCMHRLMQFYQPIPTHQRPRIIGLTGVLLDSTVTQKTILTSLNSLENTFHGTIATVSSAQEFVNVLVHSTNPKESILRYHKTFAHQRCVARISGITKRMVEKIEKWPVDPTKQSASQEYKLKKGELIKISKILKSLIKDFMYQLEDLGVYGASIAILSVMVELELKKRSCDTNRKRTLIRDLITGAELIRHILVQEMDDQDVDDVNLILTNSTAKVTTFLKYVQTYYSEKTVSKDTKALIFVQRRHTAKCLFHVVQRFADLLGLPISADFMVGSNSSLPDSIEGILDNKWNRGVVERFRRNHLNMIVASSVLEEGIDLQMCNLVFSYDAPQSYRAYAQSKGRARMSTSQYTILACHEEYGKLEVKMTDFAAIDRLLKGYLIGKTIDRAQPTEADVYNEFNKHQITPFRTSKGAVLDAVSATSLLNRYCMSLPNDIFSRSTVIWKLETPHGSDQISVSLRLPMQSTVKEDIVSDYFTDVKYAKRSAAFKACVRLYENKELNENLMPINEHLCMLNNKGRYFSHWDSTDFAKDSQTAGTSDCLRQYPIAYPEVLRACTPQLGETCYLYSINMSPDFEPVGGNEGQHKILSAKQGFGILTSKKLPPLAKMLLFMDIGAIRTQISSDPIELELAHDDKTSLQRLRKFHIMLFQDIVCTFHPFLATDHANEENSYFIVPTTNSGQLDWDTINSFQSLKAIKSPSESDSKRSKLSLVAEDYHHKVVCPWYRVDILKRYAVLSVHEHLTPFSPFPNNIYKSYAAYIKDKYDLNAINREQFMIEVKGIETRLSGLLPQPNVTSGKEKVLQRGPELLIPELCHNFAFSATLWMKATLLPSCLHRLHNLLHSEHIRQQINMELSISPAQNYEPLPVITEYKRRIKDQDNKENTIPVRSICIPNPDEVQAVKLVQSDIVTATNSINCPWRNSDEPLDLDRNTPNLYPIEVAYYDLFISQKLKELKLNDGNIDAAVASRQSAAANKHQLVVAAGAICDTSEEERKRIELLEVGVGTQTVGPEQRDILMALTTNDASDIFDMERLHVLGSAFVEFGVTLYLMQAHPTWHVGFLASFFEKLTGKRNLCYNGIAKMLPHYMKVTNFAPKNDWVPPLMSVPRKIQEHLNELNGSPHLLHRLQLNDDEVQRGTINPDTLYSFFSQMLYEPEKTESVQTASSMNNFLSLQHVSDDAVADSLVAIIGACVPTLGLERSFALLQFFNILPENKGNNIRNLLKSNVGGSPRLRSSIQDADIDKLLFNRRNFEEVLGYTFKDRAYMLQALTHPSFPYNTFTECYQKLAFLGKRIIDLLITAYTSEHAVDKHAGELRDIRAVLVNNTTWACVSVRNNFQAYILSQNSALTEKIGTFVEFQQQQRHRITEQVQLLVVESDVNMGEFIDVPSVVGDVLAALIAAVFLDSNNDLKVTWNVLYGLMHNEIRTFMQHVPLQPIERLQEFMGANPKFEEPHVDDDMTMVNLRFTGKHDVMQVQGFGRTKEEARRAAAKTALIRLEDKNAA